MIFFLKVHPQEKKIILLTFPHILPALSGKNAHIKEARLNIVWNSYLKDVELGMTMQISSIFIFALPSRYWINLNGFYKWSNNTQENMACKCIPSMLQS